MIIVAAKILLFIALGASIGFSFMMHTPEIKPWIALVLGIYGLGGLSFFPLCCEMAAESTFPCGEATSTGFMMMLGQLLAAAMMFGSVAVPQGFVPEASVCNPKEEAQDLSDFSLYLDLGNRISLQSPKKRFSHIRTMVSFRLHVQMLLQEKALL